MVRISLWYLGFDVLSALCSPVSLAILSRNCVKPTFFIVEFFMSFIEYCGLSLLLLFWFVGVWVGFVLLFRYSGLYVGWLVFGSIFPTSFLLDFTFPFSR